MSGNTIWLFDTELPQISLHIDGQTVTAIHLDEKNILLVSESQSTIVASGDEVVLHGATVQALEDGSGVAIRTSTLIPLAREGNGGDGAKDFDFSA